MQTYISHNDRWGAGPERLVLIGPPGTGKTRTALDDFVLPAIQECGPDRVLACSFSNAAADELRGRLAAALGASDASLRQTCSTIHSEALRRYRRYVNPDPKLYDPITRTSKPLKRETAPDDIAAGRANDLWEAAADAWDYIRSMRQENVPRYAGLCNQRRFTRGGKFTASELIACIEAFQNDKARDGSIDFTDMLVMALGYEGRELDLLLIDEANDCTPLQWALIDHWGQYARSVVIIGDHDQAIHRWMGAQPDLLLGRVRAWESRVLSQSWRVPAAAHSAARWLVGRIEEREDAEYAPRDHVGSAAATSWAGVVERLHKLAAEYVDTPEEMVNGELVAKPSQSAFILCRTNMMVSGIRRLLNDAAIPYPFAPSTAARVRAAIDLCRTGSCDQKGGTMLCEKLPAQFFTGTKKAALDSGDPVASLTMGAFTPDSVGTVLDAIQGVKGNKGYWLKVCETYPSWVLTSPPRIEVMTMHASKGREADVVFVSAEKPWSVEHVDDDELRLLYVAVTRTKDELYIFGEGYDELYTAIEQADTSAAPF